MIRAENVNSPDLVFQQYCNKVFGVNRGVYNTIDEWFFRAGAVSVPERRRLIVDFLEALVKVDNNSVKIGKGGLAPALLAFWEKKCA